MSQEGAGVADAGDAFKKGVANALQGAKEAKARSESPVATGLYYLQMQDGILHPRRIKEVKLPNQPRKPGELDPTRELPSPSAKLEQTLILDPEETQVIKPPPPKDSVVFEGVDGEVTLQELFAEGGKWSPLLRGPEMTPTFRDYLTSRATSGNSDLVLASTYGFILDAPDDLPRQLVANLALQTVLELQKYSPTTTVEDPTRIIADVVRAFASQPTMVQRLVDPATDIYTRLAGFIRSADAPKSPPASAWPPYSKGALEAREMRKRSRENPDNLNSWRSTEPPEEDN